MLFLAYVGFALADNIATLFVAVIFFQISLNCCFSPLGALLADHFPDEVKGRLGGLLTAALPTSTLLVVPAALFFPEDGFLPFLLIGGVVIGCQLPLLAIWGLGPVIESKRTHSIEFVGDRKQTNVFSDPTLLKDFALAWFSRVLVQTGAAFVIGYIYLYLSVTQLPQEGWVGAGASEILAALTAPSAILAIGVTLVAGFLSDRAKNRRAPLFVFACLFGVGMGLLASATKLVWFFIGYVLLQTALAAYLSVDTALIAQLVTGHPRRGLLLGVMNLSNTFPSIIVPVIALLAFNENEVAGILTNMFWGFAVAALFAGALVLLIRTVR
jgi:MFS family permease